jgi:hypothetical protein
VVYAAILLRSSAFTVRREFESRTLRQAEGTAARAATGVEYQSVRMHSGWGFESSVLRQFFSHG